MTEDVPKVAPALVHETTPALGWYSDHLLFHRVWNRPGLSRRDRSLITVSALVATGGFTQLKGHFGRALDHGMGGNELAELVTHLAFYAGWPPAMSAVTVLREVLDARGIHMPSAATVPDAVAEREETASVAAPASALLGNVIDPVIHDDLWRRPALGPRDRGLAAMTSIIAQSQWEHLPAQAGAALQQGLTAGELGEAILHLAFYLGLPRVRTAATMLDPVLAAAGGAR